MQLCSAWTMTRAHSAHNLGVNNCGGTSCRCALLIRVRLAHLLSSTNHRAALSCCNCVLQTQELQDKIDNHDPSLFEGEHDPPEEPDVIDSLLEGVLPGTAGYVGGAGAERDSYMMDILPEENEEDKE